MCEKLYRDYKRSEQMTIKLIEKTIELTETDIRTIQRALGFFEAVLLCEGELSESIKNSGLDIIETVGQIIDKKS